MYYYVNGSKLFACELPVTDSEFSEIDQQEYESRIASAKHTREVGVPADESLWL